MQKHALLSGPFLAFVALFLLIAIFHQPLRQLLARGNLTLSWGDKTISIQEIEENFDQELEAKLDVLSGEIEELRELISESQDNFRAKKSSSNDAVSSQATAVDRIKEAFSIESKDLATIIYHLGASKFKWRNQHTIAKLTGLSANKIDETARKAPELIVRGHGKAGNIIFRLTASAKQEFGAIITQKS